MSILKKAIKEAILQSFEEEKCPVGEQYYWVYAVPEYGIEDFAERVIQKLFEDEEETS